MTTGRRSRNAMMLWRLCILAHLALATVASTDYEEQPSSSCPLTMDRSCHVDAAAFNSNDLVARTAAVASTAVSDDMPNILIRTTPYGESQTFPNNSPPHLQRFVDMDAYMLNTIDQDDYYLPVRKSCRNARAECLMWAVAGECDRNARYMQLHCAPACMSCHMLSFDLRCAASAAAADNGGGDDDVWKPGDLDATFQRITQDAYYQEHYQPVVILSQPGVTNPFTRADAPWIVQLTNFASPDECETLIQLGHDQGYERSKTIGAGRDQDGTLQQVDNFGGRTSKNAWCLSDDCYHHPVAQRVIQRITNVTGMDDANAEYLQLLRYDVGDYYETHHDYIPLMKDSLPGPRILTVFLYLNDVPAGGATSFTDLNITVQPKQGSALIWPSVMNDRPNERDKRLHHAALVVEQGVKYGANAWFHQRDFKEAHARNCI